MKTAVAEPTKEAGAINPATAEQQVDVQQQLLTPGPQWSIILQASKPWPLL
jgi:hypothetical protein